MLSCILSVLGAPNANDDAGSNSNNIIFTVKEAKLHVSVVTLSAKDKQKLLKLLSVLDKRIGLNIKQKKILKIQQIIIDISLNQTL